MKRALTRAVAAAVVVVATASLHAPLASAGVHCTEKVSLAIYHQNGDVYFQTDNTCSTGWCQINYGTAEKNKTGLAMLLSVKLAERPITFFWSGINSCSEKNVLYASPGYMMLP